MLEREKTLLVVIDVQERLLPAMSDPERVLDRAARAARGCAVLGVPAIVTEQVPAALGRTVETLREAIDPYEPIEKNSFSFFSFTTSISSKLRFRFRRNSSR